MIDHLITSVLCDLDYEILSFSVETNANELTIVVKLKITHKWHEVIATVRKVIKEDKQ